MRKTLRKILTWAFGVCSALLFYGVVGEWFIRVAEQKGLYTSAGQQWDSAMNFAATTVDLVLSLLFSPWFFIPALLVVGITAGMWIDYFLKKADAETVTAKILEEKISAAVRDSSNRMARDVDKKISNAIQSLSNNVSENLLKEIQKSLPVVKQAVSNDESSGISKRLNLIEEKLSIVVDTLVHREMARLAEDTKRRLSEFEKRHRQTPTGEPAGPMPASDFGEWVSVITGNLLLFWKNDEEDISKKILKIKAEVKSDVKYLLLNGDAETERFGSGEKKREWIIQGKIIDYLKSVPMRFQKPDNFLSSIRNLK